MTSILDHLPLIGRTPAQELTRLNENERKLFERLRQTEASLREIQVDAAESIDSTASELIRLQAIQATLRHGLNNLREKRLGVLADLGRAKGAELDRQAERAEAEVSRIRREAKSAFEQFVRLEGIDLMSTEYETLFRCKSTRLAIEAASIRQRAQRLMNEPYTQTGQVRIDENASLEQLLEMVQNSESDRPSIQAVCEWWDRSMAAIAAQPGGFGFSGRLHLNWSAGQIDTAASLMHASRIRNERIENIEVRSGAIAA